MKAVVWALLVAVIVLPPMVLTTVGARSREAAWPLALLAGVCFPVTWTVWYLRDEHPYRQSGHQT